MSLQLTQVACCLMVYVFAELFSDNMVQVVLVVTTWCPLPIILSALL